MSIYWAPKENWTEADEQRKRKLNVQEGDDQQNWLFKKHIKNQGSSFLKHADLRHEFPECNRQIHNMPRWHAVPPNFPGTIMTLTLTFPLDSLFSHWLLLIWLAFLQLEKFICLMVIGYHLTGCLVFQTLGYRSEQRKPKSLLPRAYSRGIKKMNKWHNWNMLVDDKGYGTKPSKNRVCVCVGV